MSPKPATKKSNGSDVSNANASDTPFRIGSAGVLVSLRISQWLGRRGDKSAASEVAENKSAERSMVSLHKALVDPKSLKAIREIATEARLYHYEQTLPWEDGKGFLPTSKIQPYTERMQTYRMRFETATRDFYRVYTDLVKAARTQLGDLYREDDYPDLPKIRTLFDLRYVFEPVPEESQFQTHVVGDGLEDMRRELVAENQRREVAMRRDLWERLYKPVSHLAAKLGDEEAIFRDSTVRNVRELAETVLELDVFKDPSLQSMARELTRTLGSLDPDKLRDNKSERRVNADAAARAAKRIARTMEALSMPASGGAM